MGFLKTSPKMKLFQQKQSILGIEIEIEIDSKERRNNAVFRSLEIAYATNS